MSRRAVIRLVGLAVVIAVAVVGVSVASGAGQAQQAWNGKWSPLRQAHTAAGTYLYGGATRPIGGHKYTSVTLKCPASHPHAIGGMFDSKGAAVEATSASPAPNKWIEGGINLNSTPTTVFLGVVCAR